MNLDTSIEFLKGVGPARAELLQKDLGIFTLSQLLHYYPFRHIDRTSFHKIKELHADIDYAQIKGVLVQLESVGQGRAKRARAIFKDETGQIELVWFQGIHWALQYKVGMEYVLFGRVNFFNGKINIAHPELELQSGSANEKSLHFEPVYSIPEKLQVKKFRSKDLAKLVKTLFLKIAENPNSVEENLSPNLLRQYKFLPRLQSLRAIHFPHHLEELKAAKNRLKFEELFYMQLKMWQGRTFKKTKLKGFVLPAVGDIFHKFYNENLKFPLTEAQKRVIKEIRKDMSTASQMNRLLQGDVGSGKTVVAFMCMLIAIDNGFQASLMAPTEILAQQHFKSIQEMSADLGIQIELLTGSVKGKKRKEILDSLEKGEIHILIGTHALIEEKVKFKKLALTIIDEQHRFGVSQRARMWEKNNEAIPHVLVMTATPIPRTLAMTVYGDLDVSVIDEMPAGRIPIETFHKFESHRLWTFGMMKKEIAAGRQVYVVFPLIEESGSETMADIKNLMEGYEAISKDFPKPQYQISIVHGRQKPEEKEFEMQRFIKGETQIMIATTVIEVGVNVPNATLMVIENAERFGLAQLHQLRGRVGRGAAASYCILMTGYKLSEESRFRMEIMCETTDGFRIAEADLKLRGPGSIEGTQQSGIVGLQLADIVKDANILTAARQTAIQIIEEDPDLEKPENQALKKYLAQSKAKQNWSNIS
jgi:ATP-dependent DNA helicase RecG